MDSVNDILKKFNPLEDKPAARISREYQSFGVHLAQKLQDVRNKSMYIKFAKTIPRPVLEAAYRFVVDANAKNKAALFIWKLKDLGMFKPKPKIAKVTVKKPRKNAKKTDG
jgi:hypothetical protein